jgi:hypothetical protein
VKDPATMFMLYAVQEWGQTDAERVAAVQGVLDAAGWNARAEGFPVFGARWSSKVCSGPDGVAAATWLKELTGTMPRGEFNAEKWHVQTFIDKRRNTEAARP